MTRILYQGTRPPTVPVVDESRCKGCNLCVWLCPPQALKLSEGLSPQGYHLPALVGTCTGCRVCEAVCPDFAIAVVED